MYVCVHVHVVICIIDAHSYTELYCMCIAVSVLCIRLLSQPNFLRKKSLIPILSLSKCISMYLPEILSFEAFGLFQTNLKKMVEILKIKMFPALGR